jgi:glycerol transport system ATP-binding protein
VRDQTGRLGDDIEFPLIDHMQSLPDGRYIFGVRSNHLFLNQKSSDDSEIRTKVELAEINGSETFIHANYNGSKLVVQEDGVHPHRIGSEISIYVNPCCFFAFDERGTLIASPSRITIEKRLK